MCGRGATAAARLSWAVIRLKEAMQSEEQTPIEQRYLRLEGLVSESVLVSVVNGLPKDAPANSRVCFVGFSYADLSLPKEFDLIFDLSLPENALPAASRVIAATQQYGKPFAEIPHGWKTICVIEFPGGVPALIERLPVVDAWYESSVALGLCTSSAYASIVERHRSAV